MPPGLSKGAKQIIKTYGGWTRFMAAYGKNVNRVSDRDEAKAIVEELVKSDEKTLSGSGGQK